jgi:hypothetical protein
MVSIADKIGCTAQGLNEGAKKTEVDAGKRVGSPATWPSGRSTM